jgi:DNA polymerase-3 subunit epsilon
LLARSLLRRRDPRSNLTADQIRAWRRRRAPSLRAPHAAMRYVVVDVETSGLDTRADRMISIGAAGVERGELRVDDTFAAVLRQSRSSDADNILIHQIGAEAQLSGADPRQTLLDFLEFAGKAPLVAFRAEFDRVMLERACKEKLGFRPTVPWIDLAFVLPALFQNAHCGTLDEWLAHFNLEAVDRHDALCDAWATAELLLIALAAADRVGAGTAGDLVAAQKAQRWLGIRR